MVYDYRELVFKEMLSLDPDDPYYFTKRFRKAYHLLDKDSYDRFKGALKTLLDNHGIGTHGLHRLEKRLKTSSGLKLKQGSTLRIIAIDKIIRDLSVLDDALDIEIKKLANTIRWSGTLELNKNTRQREN